MKILYVANERSAAQLAATALRNISPDLIITWARQLSDATRWISDNPDLAAVLVEDRVDNKSSASFVGQVRRLGLTAPVVVIGSEEMGPPLGALRAGADDYVASNQSLVADLPDVVSRALARAQTTARRARQPLRFLYIGDSALARECLENFRCSIEIAEAVPGPNATFQPVPPEFPAAGLPLPFDILVVEYDHPGVDAFAILKSIAAHRLQIPVIFVVERDEDLAVPALKLGAVDCVVKTKDSLRALFFRLDRVFTLKAQSKLRGASLETQLRSARADNERTHREHSAALQRWEEALNRLNAAAAAAAATKERLEQQVRDVLAEAGETERRFNTEVERLRENEIRLQTTIHEERANRGMLEQKLAEAKAALLDAEQRHASEATTTAALLVERQARYYAGLTQLAAAGEALEQRLADAETSLQQAEQRHASDMTASAAQFAERHAEYETRLARAAEARDTLARRLSETAMALERARQDRASDAAATAEQLTRRDAELAAMLAEATATRQALELRLADAESACRQAEEHQTAFEARLDQEVAKGKAVESELAETRVEFEQAQRRFVDEAEALRERTREREARLEERVARERADQENTLAEIRERVRHLQDELRLALETRTRDRCEIEQLQSQLKTLGHELEVTRSDREVLRTEADRVPQLQSQLEESRAENRRQFESTPYGMCWFGRDGALKQVNHALVALLGYETAGELRTVDFATGIFESPDDLRWLIERSLNTGTRESVEATWRRKDGGRLVVRLFALAAACGAIEMVAEDITNLRSLEERLRQAQRMEAVGRLASEVAVTCDNLLRDVSQGGRHWLAAISSDTALRQQGELLLDEVTRAASFLRQLAVYGKKQTSALEPVDVIRVLRDLAPVLKQVAGDDIEVVLPKTSSPMNVDVEAECVERVLVNVAGYGRQRMPFGGRLMIELTTVVVDGRFVAQYPNVRPGAHVLITVTEARRTVRSHWPIGLRDEQAGANTKGSPSDRPGVDLGTLQGLIRDCGGHLWMTAEPTGNMELKIHLPQPVLDAAADPRASRIQSDRGRSMTRWLRH